MCGIYTHTHIQILVLGKGEGNLISYSTHEHLCLLSWVSYSPAHCIHESLSKLLSISGKARKQTIDEDQGLQLWTRISQISLFFKQKSVGLWIKTLHQNVCFFLQMEKEKSEIWVFLKPTNFLIANKAWSCCSIEQRCRESLKQTSFFPPSSKSCHFGKHNADVKSWKCRFLNLRQMARGGLTDLYLLLIKRGT